MKIYKIHYDSFKSNATQRASSLAVVCALTASCCNLK